MRLICQKWAGAWFAVMTVRVQSKLLAEWKICAERRILAAMTLREWLLKIGDENTAIAAIVVKDNRVLLGLRHYTPDVWKKISVWTSPGGKCEKGETYGKTLRREVYEETGIKDVDIKDFIGEIPGAKAGVTVPMFYCETKEEPKLMEPEKFSEWRWVPFSEYYQGAPGVNLNPTARAFVSMYLKNRFPDIE